MTARSPLDDARWAIKRVQAEQQTTKAMWGVITEAIEVDKWGNAPEPMHEALIQLRKCLQDEMRIKNAREG